MIITLDHIEDIAQNIKTFWFKPEASLDYIAGQFIEMTLPHDNPDLRGQKHWFTLSSSPSEPLIGITTKHATDHVSTFKQKLFSLTKGSRVNISEAMGDFVLPKDPTIPLVFVAGGIGVTPIRSMVKWLKDMGETRNIHILYSASSLPEVAFKDLIESYGCKFDIILTNPPTNWSGLTGYLTGKKIMELSRFAPDQLIFISGPEPMTETLEGELLSLGVPSERLVLDFFPGYAEF